MMTSHLNLQREECLNQLLRVLSFLKTCQSTELVFDPSNHVVGTTAFERSDWASSEFGYDLNEGAELLDNVM